MILLLFTVLVGGGACIVKYQTISQKREVSTEEISEEYLIPGNANRDIYGDERCDGAGNRCDRGDRRR